MLLTSRDKTLEISLRTRKRTHHPARLMYRQVHSTLRDKEVNMEIHESNRNEGHTSCRNDGCGPPIRTVVSKFHYRCRPYLRASETYPRSYVHRRLWNRPAPLTLFTSGERSRGNGQRNRFDAPSCSTVPCLLTRVYCGNAARCKVHDEVRYKWEVV